MSWGREKKEKGFLYFRDTRRTKKDTKISWVGGSSCQSVDRFLRVSYWSKVGIACWLKQVITKKTTRFHVRPNLMIICLSLFFSHCSSCSWWFSGRMREKSKRERETGKSKSEQTKFLLFPLLLWHFLPGILFVNVNDERMKDLSFLSSSCNLFVSLSLSLSFSSLMLMWALIIDKRRVKKETKSGYKELSGVKTIKDEVLRWMKTSKERHEEKHEVLSIVFYQLLSLLVSPQKVFLSWLWYWCLCWTNRRPTKRQGWLSVFYLLLLDLVMTAKDNAGVISFLSLTCARWVQ